MSATTPALWQASSAFDQQDPFRDQSAIPVARLAITYVLLFPLILFAVHGGFSFEHGGWNSNLGAIGGRMAVASSDSETLRDRIQAWMGLGICLMVMIPEYKRIGFVSQQMRLTLSLPALAVLSALWSQDAGLSLRSGLSLLVTTLFSLYLASSFGERQVMQLIILTGACVAILNLAVVVGWPQYGVDHQLHEGAWQGLFTQKNVCAEATLFMLTPALSMSGTGRYSQLLGGFYICLSLLVIFMTQSRTGWGITVLYLVFLAGVRALGKFERKGLLPLAGSVFAVLAALVVLAVQYPSVVLSLISRGDSLSGRQQIWSAVAASVLRRPIGGYGFDAFWSLMQGEASRVFAATGWVVTSAHNGFLNVGLELGLVGLLLVAAVFVQAFRNANIAFVPGHSEYTEWCIGVVFLTVIYNLDERTIMATQYLPWILFIIACHGLQRASRPIRALSTYSGIAVSV